MTVDTVDPPHIKEQLNWRNAGDMMLAAEQKLRLAAAKDLKGERQKQALKDADDLFNMRLKWC